MTTMFDQFDSWTVFDEDNDSSFTSMFNEFVEAKIASAVQDTAPELERQLHNAWKGNRDLRNDFQDQRILKERLERHYEEVVKSLSDSNKKIESLNEENGRLEAGAEGYQDSLRIYIEEGANLRKENAKLSDAHFEGAKLILGLNSDIDDLKAAADIHSIRATQTQGRLDFAQKSIVKRNKKIRDLDRQVQDQDKSIELLRSSNHRLEDIVETLDNPSLPDEPAPGFNVPEYHGTLIAELYARIEAIRKRLDTPISDFGEDPTR